MKVFVSRFTFLLPLLGFYFVSYFVDLSIPSEIIIFARILALIFCLITIFSFKFQFSKFQLFFVSFLTLYFLKLLNDVMYTNLDFGKSHLETILFTLGITIIPAIAFLFSNVKRQFIFSGKYLYYGFNFLTIIALIANDNDQGRLSGNSILNPITVGHVAASALLINLLYLFQWKKVNKNSFLLIAMFSLTSLLGLIFAASRGPILAFVISILTYLVILKKISFRFLIIISTIFFLLGPIILHYSSKFGFAFSSRMHLDYKNTDSKSTEVRVFLWEKGINIFIENPILGKSTTTDQGYPHNFYIELLMSTGLVGLIIYLVPFIKALKNIPNHIKSENLYMKWLGLLFIQYLIGSLFSGTIYSNDFYWMFFALLLSNPIKGLGQMSLKKISEKGLLSDLHLNHINKF